MSNKLYVGNLSYETTEADLKDMFGEYGTVTSAKLIVDRDSGRSKGFAFVEMGSDSEAEAAIEGTNGNEFKGRALKVNEAQPQQNRGGGGGRY